AQGLRESRLFLAILSPNFFASDFCRREWEEYTRYEAMRQCLGEGVAPVYFIELPGLDTGEIDDLIAEWVQGPRQWCDLASQTPVEIARWHEKGKQALEDTHVANRLQELKSEIAERLKRADRAKESPTNIYRHNAQFVGRVRELTQLRHAVSEQGSVGVVGHSQRPDAGAVAVHGVGGMGKTELALAYSHAFAWDYPGGRWLAACEHVSDFNLVLRQLAEPLGVEFTEEENKDVHLAGERILRVLRQRERSLLLLDNVDDPALLTPDVLMRLPRNVHMLATTRMGPMQLAGRWIGIPSGQFQERRGEARW
ncbi:MAG: TIR domain-containing protein, partial [bacterium]|nr:TIR domain-containing protein [bacterium]